MENTKYYDLTYAQNVMYFALKYSPKKNIANIGSSLWINEECDIELFKKAVIKSIERIDALRIRLTKVNGKVKQYVSPEADIEIPVVDYTDKTVKEIEEIFDSRAKVEMKWKECPLINMLIAKAPGNRVAFDIVINHVISDAWGLTVFIKDVMDIYQALRDGEELPEKPSDFMPIVEKELQYNDSERMKEDFEYWKDKFKTMPDFASVEPKAVGKPFRKVASFNFNSRAKIYVLPKDRVDKVNSYCRKERISPQIIYMLAAYNYFAMLNNKEGSVIYNVLARRSDMVTKKASGMMINILMLQLKCTEDMTFREACDYVADTQFEGFRHGDYPYQILDNYVWKLYRPNIFTFGQFTDLSFTYQAGKIVTKKPMDYEVKYHSNGSSGMAVYLTIMDAADKGTLNFIYEYREVLADEELIKMLFCQMIKTVELGIENPEMTLKEIRKEVSNLDIDSYEEVLTNAKNKTVNV